MRVSIAGKEIASSGNIVARGGGEGVGEGVEKGRVTPPTAPSYVMHFYPDNGVWSGGGGGGIANS